MIRKITYLTLILMFQAFLSFAQHDPDKEILVFFTSGVSRTELKTLEGSTVNQAKINNNELKYALRKIGIDESMLEIAMPWFRQSDTLHILSDSTRLLQLDMTKLFRIRVPEEKSRKEWIAQLSALPEVLYADANGTISPNTIPSDVQFSSQWGLKNTVHPGSDVHAEKAWDIYTGNPANIIGIIDGGTDINHLDLNDKIASADAGYGWDGHGIHVSGIAAAESNNGQGVSGVDWRAKILAKRIDNISDDAKTYQAIVDAVNYSPNVCVLNNSWGTVDNQKKPGRYSSTLEQAFVYAYKANRTVVGAAGNSQIDYPGVIEYPVSFKHVIGVAATDIDDQVAYFSNQNAFVDVAAPGVNILSTYMGNSYTTLSGTSMATPFVAGIASLLKGYNPNLANDDIENIIKLSADKVGNDSYSNGYNTKMGYGRANAESALKLLQLPNTLSQWTASGGTITNTTGNQTAVFYSAPGLAAGNYIVKRSEITKSITFPYSFCQITGMWVRGVGSVGYSAANPNFGETYAEIVPGTLSNTGVTLRTYVYHVYNTIGQDLGYYPTAPANVKFAYTVLGQANNYAITGPDSFCTTDTYQVPDLPAGASVSWSSSNNISIQSNNGSSITVAQNATVSSTGNIKAVISSACGQVNLTKDIFFDLFIPTIYDVSENIPICPGSIYYAYNGDSADGYYNWQVAGGSIISGQGSSTVGFVADPLMWPSTYNTVGLYLIIHNSCGKSLTKGISISVTNCNNGGMNWIVYPNPAANTLTVNYENELTKEKAQIVKDFEVLLLNDKDKLIQQAKNNTNSKNITLDTHNIPNGTYYLHITYGEEIIKKQVIIQH